MELYLYVLIRRATASRPRGQFRRQSFPSRFSQQTTVLSVPRCDPLGLSVIALILVSTVVDRVLNKTQIVKGCKVKLSVVPPNTASKNEDPSAAAATVSIYVRTSRVLVLCSILPTLPWDRFGISLL